MILSATRFKRQICLLKFSIDFYLCLTYNNNVKSLVPVKSTEASRVPNKNVRILIDSEMLDKLKVISAYERRPVSSEIIACIEAGIKLFEEKNGKIEDLK